MEYEVVIGLEVHVHLKTDSKIFCGCSTRFGAPPNTQVCPVCLGFPGVLPVLNRRAVELAVKTGLMLGCEITERSKFDRKNYFYPDLPKAYQISQYDMPIAAGGEVRIVVDGRAKVISLTRAHLEEDAGKLVHYEGENESGVDYNRCGVPLLEIVSEPDIRSAEEAAAYLRALKGILEYLDVSDCNMEEGSLRCDANISVRKKGETSLGVKTEVKNMNSFKAVQKALTHEAARQQKIIEGGGRIEQETRLWNQDLEKTISMRSKEEAHDYRYFPEPDLVPVILERGWVEEIRASLPESPLDRTARFQEEYGLPEYDATVLTAERGLADFFEECTRLHADAKAVSNWVMGDLLRELNEREMGIGSCPLRPSSLAGLLKLIADGTISTKIAKEVFAEMFESGRSPREIVEEKGLVQISDESEIEATVDRVIGENEKSVRDYRSGTKKALSFLVGQVMKHTRGKANPKIVNELLRKKLEQE